MIEIKVPPIGESINEATISQWIKQDGDHVEQDEVICELESEKASFELNAEESGTLKINVQEGEDVKIGQTIGTIDETASKPQDKGETEKDSSRKQQQEAGTQKEEATEQEKATKEEPSLKKEKPAENKSAASSHKGVIEIKIPSVGESISEVTLLSWSEEEGAYVEQDEVICELESEKATFELNAEEAGELHQLAKEGDNLRVGDVIAKINTDVEAPEEEGGSSRPAQRSFSEGGKQEAAAGSKAGTQKEEPFPHIHDRITVEEPEQTEDHISAKATPLASAMMAENKVKPSDVKGSGPQGKIFRQDVLAALERPGTNLEKDLFSREERREKMSNLRKTISRRLVEAKNATAMLTTFNEVDMSHIMAIRKKYKQVFKETHNVGLGFMSFFTKACCFALQEWPAVNAYFDDNELVYHDYCDISIAVSTPRGLVVPVIRNAESLSMAGIEKEVVTLAKKARDNKLSMEEMTGGTFTITNGGVFGSLMSTPVLNIPQSAILGMHKIEERPVALNGQVVIKPMMYLALSYDHRVIDGKESVSFLVRVKELLENPEQLLFGKDPVKTLLEL